MSITTRYSQEFHEPAKVHWISWNKWQIEVGYKEDVSSDVTDHVLHRVLCEAEGLGGHIVLG